MERKSATRLSVLVAAIGILLPAIALSSRGHSTAQAVSNQQDKGDAITLFKQNCAKCHGEDGRAKTFRGKLVGARNLSELKWQESITDEQISAAIKNGPGAMPSFEKKFSPAQMDLLIAYVRHFKGGRQDTNQRK